jgi:uncharacterized iron-regulated membrane protein
MKTTPYHPRNPVRRWFHIWGRRAHRWAAVACMLPLVVVISTGLLLQLKKQIAWVQPSEQRGVGTVPTISMDAVLEAARSAEGTNIESWADIKRLDIRPGKGIVKVITPDGFEIQIDAETARVLQVARRRSDLIESLHDGSFFGPFAKLGIFLPVGFLLLGLWFSGVYLWFLPIIARRNGRRRRARRANQA